MPLTLKVTASEPFDDEKFLMAATPVINGLSDTSLNSTERMDLDSAFYTVTAMKVSPEFYPAAVNVTRLFFYLVSSSEAYEELDKKSGLATHNPDVKASLKAQADADIGAAEDAWRGLTFLYPNSTLFG